MVDDQILDVPVHEEQNTKFVKTHLASGGKRFANMLVDTLVFLFVYFLGVGFMMSTFVADLQSTDAAESQIAGVLGTVYGGGLFLWLCYFWGMETLTGKTVGKFITRTRIVKADGSKPSGINVLGRSLARLIPFDAFSYLGEKENGWHDAIPGIYVINDV